MSTNLIYDTLKVIQQRLTDLETELREDRAEREQERQTRRDKPTETPEDIQEELLNFVQAEWSRYDQPTPFRTLSQRFTGRLKRHGLAWHTFIASLETHNLIDVLTTAKHSRIVFPGGTLSTLTEERLTEFKLSGAGSRLVQTYLDRKDATLSSRGRTQVNPSEIDPSELEAAEALGLIEKDQS